VSRRAGLTLRWGAVLACSGAIFWLSHLPQSSLPVIGPEFPQKDKLHHLIAYAVWGGLFSMALRATWPGLGLRSGILLVLLGGVLYGASDEFHQSFVPTRQADLADLAADAAGALLGAVIHALCWRSYRKNGR
jgi:VanZ family protein